MEHPRDNHDAALKASRQQLAELRAWVKEKEATGKLSPDEADDILGPVCTALLTTDDYLRAGALLERIERRYAGGEGDGRLR